MSVRIPEHSCVCVFATNPFLYCCNDDVDMRKCVILPMTHCRSLGSEEEEE